VVRTEGKTTMRKKTQMQKRNQKPADSVLKTSKKKDIELTEKELGKVTGGLVRKSGNREFIVVKLNDVIVS
jgi:hypothetical protein